MDKNSFVIGILFLLYGLLSLIELEFLEFLFTTTIVDSVIVLAGIYLLFILYKKTLNVKIATILASLILIFMGLFPLLIEFRLISLNFIPILDLNKEFLEVIIIVFGIYNIVDSLYLN